MALLAIKGHEIRGKEIIEILEMLGGKNQRAINATNKKLFFRLRESDNVIVGTFPTDKLAFFTLEEFQEKYPYKVGDKVLFKHENTIYFIRKMYWEKDKILYQLSDEVYSDGCSVPDTLIFDVDAEKLQPYKKENMEEKNNDNWAKWDLPVGYEFQDKEGNVINTDTIKLVKKQPSYPKSYVMCANLLGCFGTTFIDGYQSDLLEKFQELLICRDYYWELAGKEMGLGKPWVFENPSRRYVYTIEYCGGKIHQLSLDVKNGNICKEIISVYNKVANPENRNIKGQIFHIKDDFDKYKDLWKFDEMIHILSTIDNAETDYIGYKGGDELKPISKEDIYHWVNLFADLMVSYVVHNAYEDDCRVLYEKYVTNGISEN